MSLRLSLSLSLSRCLSSPALRFFRFRPKELRQLTTTSPPNDGVPDAKAGSAGRGDESIRHEADRNRNTRV